MNLHAMASGAISAVNPMVPVAGKVSTGYTVGADGGQVPVYSTLNGITGQVQPLSANDLKKLQGLNIQGVTAKVFLTGNFEGAFRSLGRGGDLLTIGGSQYLVTTVLERWPDWTAVGVTIQVGT